MKPEKPTSIRSTPQFDLPDGPAKMLVVKRRESLARCTPLEKASADCSLTRTSPREYVQQVLTIQMASKEPTRHQLSSRLQYQSHVPAFLHKFHNKVKGIASEDDDDEEPQYYDDGSGRPPIPVRPAIPERPSDDPGSADEDDGDEKPQVVVLKAGKHLTEREAENERRKGFDLVSRFLSAALMCF